jgi:hypothetical protein
VDSRLLAIDASAYALRDELVAQAYMLISMPTGSSAIFGAFQNIFLLRVIKSCFVGPTERKPQGLGDRRALRAGFASQLNVFLRSKSPEMLSGAKLPP